MPLRRARGDSCRDDAARSGSGALLALQARPNVVDEVMDVERRSVILFGQVKPSEEERIRTAARVRGVSMSEFVRRSVLQAADDVLDATSDDR